MTGFTDEQVKWLDAVVLKQPDDPNIPPDPVAVKTAADKLMAGFKADTDKQAKREKFLTKMNGDIAGLREQIKSAQTFQVTWEPDEQAKFWQRASKAHSMNWSEANASKENRKGGKKSTVDKKERMIRDIEVDTKHDLSGKKGKYVVKGDKIDKTDPDLNWEEQGANVRKLLTMHAKLVDMQTEMENAVGDDGKPLFTARDIERELWSPLVKADIIPSNAVADKYSQEAQVFNGAAEVYEERLKEYSKKASKHVKKQRALRIAGDFVVMAGQMAPAIARSVEFSGASMSMADKRELEVLKAENKATPFDPGTPNALRLEQLGDMSQSSKELALEQGAISLTVAFLSGAFDVTSKSLDRPSETKSWKVAEATFNAIAASAISAVGIYGANLWANENAPQEEKDKAVGLTKTVQSLITYGLSGSKIIFRLKEALDAPENGKDKFIKAIVVSLGDAVGSAFAAFDQPKVKNDDGTVLSEGTGGEWGKIGAYVSTAIASTANIAEIIRMIDAAKKDGRPLDGKSVLAAFGLTALGPIMAGTYDIASDNVRTDIGKKGEGSNPFAETDKEKELRDLGDVQALQNMAKSLPNMTSLVSAFKEIPGEEELADKVSSEANARNAAKTKAELKSLAEEINKDPKKKKALTDSIVEENEVKKAEILKLISIASSPTAMVDPTAKNTEAKAAMDRLIAESEASKAQWAALDAITAGGVGILVSFLPAAGLAVAVRQLVSDVAWLIKKSKELNLWQKNMALTFGNDSVYGPAINSRLANAEIQFSQKTVNVIFSLVGVTAESLRLADITGAATGIAIGNTMARALTDFGYKMQKEAEIDKGWKLYKKARSSEGAGDRKLARKAMRWNSTLSKCVIAYGIVKDSDPIAAEVARNCGLSPEVLSDENDVCQRVVTYFLSVYSDDPVVMKRIPVVKDWHPAIPKLELEVWLKFKAAAVTKAVPPLAEASTRTTLIDTALADIDALWKGKGYVTRRDELAKALAAAREKAAIPPPDKDDDDDSEMGEEELSQSEDDNDDEPSVSGSGDDELDPIETHPAVMKARKDYMDFLTEAMKQATAAIDALNGYIPENGPRPKEASIPWTEGSLHRDMSLVVESLSAQAMILRSEIDYDTKVVA